MESYTTRTHGSFLNSYFHKEHFDILLLYLLRICIRTRTVRYFDKIFESKFSKTTRQKFKMCIHFYRTDVALSEYEFTLNFCRVVFEKIDSNVRLRYGTHTVRKQVRCS